MSKMERNVDTQSISSEFSIIPDLPNTDYDENNETSLCASFMNYDLFQSNMNSSACKKVKFLKLQYLGDKEQKLAVTFKYLDNFEHRLSHRIGLYKQGFTSSKDFIVFSWVPHLPDYADSELENSLTVFINCSQILDPENQFKVCYLDENGEICGTSSLFQIKEEDSEEKEIEEAARNILSIRVQELSAENAHLQKALKDLNETHENFQSKIFSETVFELTQQLSEFEGKVKEFEKLIELKEEELNNKEDQIKSYVKTIEAQTNELAEKEIQRKEYEVEIYKVEQEYQKAVMENKDCTIDLNDMKQLYDEVENKRNILEERQQVLVQDNEDFKASLDTVKRELELCINEKVASEKIAATLSEHLQYKDKKVADLSETNDHLVEKIDKLKTELMLMEINQKQASAPQPGPQPAGTAAITPPVALAEYIKYFPDFNRSGGLNATADELEAEIKAPQNLDESSSEESSSSSDEWSRIDDQEDQECIEKQLSDRENFFDSHENAPVESNFSLKTAPVDSNFSLEIGPVKSNFSLETAPVESDVLLETAPVESNFPLKTALQCSCSSIISDNNLNAVCSEKELSDSMGCMSLSDNMTSSRLESVAESVENIKAKVEKIEEVMMATRKEIQTLKVSKSLEETSVNSNEYSDIKERNFCLQKKFQTWKKNQINELSDSFAFIHNLRERNQIEKPSHSLERHQALPDPLQPQTTQIARQAAILHKISPPIFALEPSAPRNCETSSTEPDEDWNCPCNDNYFASGLTPPIDRSTKPPEKKTDNENEHFIHESDDDYHSTEAAEGHEEYRPLRISDSLESLQCPMCPVRMDSDMSFTMETHIDGHLDKVCPSCSLSFSRDTAQETENRGSYSRGRDEGPARGRGNRGYNQNSYTQKTF